MGRLSDANRRALAYARERTPEPPPGSITLHFQPDTRLPDGGTVADPLLAEGVYRNQFETGISFGALGTDRERWEDALFGGAYRDAPAGERPRYGGLNVAGDSYGACPGFGSCHLRLRREANERSTYLFGDSSDALADYIEVQVHGVVELVEDVEAVVVDPCFEGTAAGRALAAAADRYGFALEWHDGIALPLDAIPTTVPDGARWEWEEFCGDGRARALAERITGGAPLDAAQIGRAADEYDPAQLKYLWRMTAAYGR